MVPEEHNLLVTHLSEDTDQNAMTAVVRAAGLHKTQVWCGEEEEEEEGGNGGDGSPITSLESRENDTDISNSSSHSVTLKTVCVRVCVRVQC